ncbi:MAG: CPBP family glutamic-type intramembrane protease [Myxococcota bacterium]
MLLSSAEAPPVALPESRLSRLGLDLALTLPIFVAYHLGVVLLKVRNAADLVTAELTRLAESHIVAYWALTLAVGAALASFFVVLTRGRAFASERFVLVALEGIVYAILMRSVALHALGALPLSVGLGPQVSGVIMSLGAGFYEELIFRVGLFGGGLLGLRLLFGTLPRIPLAFAWAVICAAIFSGWHYIGPLADGFRMDTFIFRAVCGLVLTAIFRFRGFAPAVWTHATYDVWALGVI